MIIMKIVEISGRKVLFGNSSNKDMPKDNQNKQVRRITNDIFKM